MKILITGGAGFIGSAVFNKLKNEGHEIFVIDNLSFGNKSFIEIDEQHFFHTDIRDAGSMADIVKKLRPDYVLHLAAIHFIPYCNAHPFESSDINIRGTMNLLSALEKTDGLKKLFFASTAAVYPISEAALDESVPPAPLDIYGLSKLAGEDICRRFYLQTGIDTIVCRFFNAFGPNETNPHLIPEIEKQLQACSRRISLGNLTPRRDFIHTHDMADAVKRLLEWEGKGFEIFNLGRGIEYSVVDIVDSFSRTLNEKIEIDVDSARVRKVERQHLLADVSKLKSKTGWEPQWGIDEGIANLVSSWR